MNIQERLQNDLNRSRGAWALVFFLLTCAVPGLLRAQADSSSHAYLYLDTYQARFECLLSVPDIMGPQSENFELPPQEPAHLWSNQGRRPLRTPLVEVPPPPHRPHLEVPLASLLWLGLGMVFLSLRHISGGRVSGRAFMTWM